jgi:hypothetical protein
MLLPRKSLSPTTSQVIDKVIEYFKHSLQVKSSSGDREDRKSNQQSEALKVSDEEPTTYRTAFAGISREGF